MRRWKIRLDRDSFIAFVLDLAIKLFRFFCIGQRQTSNAKSLPFIYRPALGSIRCVGPLLFAFFDFAAALLRQIQVSDNATTRQMGPPCDATESEKVQLSCKSDVTLVIMTVLSSSFMLRETATLTAICGFLAMLTFAQTRDELWSRCRATEPDLSIGGCTAIIQLEQETTNDLATAFYNRGNAYSTKGDNDRAMRDYDEAIRLNPKFSDAFYNRGNVVLDKGDNDRAIRDYDEAIRLNPKFSDALNNRGRAYRAKGDNDRAIQDFDEAIRLDPNDTLAFLDRGRTYQRKGDTDRATQDFEQAFRIDQALSFFSRGNAYATKGDYDRAIPEYDEAVRVNPEFAEAFINRGNMYREKGDFDRAVQDYDQAIQVNPDNVLALNNRGFTKFLMSKFSDAGTDFSLSVDLDFKDAYLPLWLHLARANAGQADPDEFARNTAKLDHSIWPGPVIRLYLGRVTPEETLTLAENGVEGKTRRDRTCQAKFYVGEYLLSRGDVDTARLALQEASSICSHTFLEYDAAMSELRRIH